MILRNSLYLTLALTLISVPVSQAAHALTHITDVATINLVDGDHDQDESDIDKICPDCLALTTFSDISSILVYSFRVHSTQQQLSLLTRSDTPQNFSSDYHSRAPPLA